MTGTHDVTAAQTSEQLLMMARLAVVFRRSGLSRPAPPASSVDGRADALAELTRPLDVYVLYLDGDEVECVTGAGPEGS